MVVVGSVWVVHGEMAPEGFLEALSVFMTIAPVDSGAMPPSDATFALIYPGEHAEGALQQARAAALPALMSVQCPPELLQQVPAALCYSFDEARQCSFALPLIVLDGENRTAQARRLTAAANQIKISAFECYLLPNLEADE